MKPYCKLAQYQLAVQPMQPSSWWSWWQGTLSAPSQLWRFCHSVSQNCKPARQNTAPCMLYLRDMAQKHLLLLAICFHPMNALAYPSTTICETTLRPGLRNRSRSKITQQKKRFFLTSASREAVMPRRGVAGGRGMERQGRADGRGAGWWSATWDSAPIAVLVALCDSHNSLMMAQYLCMPTKQRKIP